MFPHRSIIPAVVFALLFAVVSEPASAACVNKFVRRTEGGNRQVLTLLTGKLTFDEAKTLSASIAAHSAPLLEWVDDGGKTITRQFGELKVVRPMPVGCDGRSSGVVIVVTFVSVSTPIKKMNVKLDPNTTVAFEEQTE